MKPREFFYLLGLRPSVRAYGFEVHHFDLPEDGRVEYARWLHPSESDKVISQEAVDALREFLRPGDVAVDIGAHTGDTAIPMALAVGPEGRVLALEPNRYVFPVLEKNATLNRDKTQIVPLMFAATETDGPVEFEYSDSGFCNGGRHEGVSRWRHGHAFKLRVEGRNLESFLRDTCPDLIPRLRYVKVDAEGYDRAIIQSMSSLLTKCRPYLRAEVFKKLPADMRVALFDTVKELGYDIYRLEDEARYRGQRIDRTDVKRWAHFDIFCVPEERV